MSSQKKTLKALNNKQDLIMVSLKKFYKEKDNIEQLLPIVNGGSKLSLRIIDWFVTNYSKKNNVIYYLKRTKKGVNDYSYSKEGDDEYSDPFIVYIRYKSQLDGFQKRLFDPFCRIGKNGNRIEFFYDDKDSIVTTVGQLNFFKWAIENNILAYIKDNIAEIEQDMNKNIRKLSPTTKKNKKGKKKSNKAKQDKISGGTSQGNSQSKRRKRRELSVSATKTFNKHKFNIVLEFE
jgi:hypothetical protein